MSKLNIFRAFLILALIILLLSWIVGNASCTHRREIPSGDPRIVIEWDAPETNSDGTALDDLEFYRIYYSHRPGEYSGTPVSTSTETSADVPVIYPTTYYVVTAVDVEGNESIWSNEIIVER